MIVTKSTDWMIERERERQREKERERANQFLDLDKTEARAY